MNDEEILQKAIKKAIDGGWEQPWVYYHGNAKNTKDKFNLWLDNTIADFLNSESHVYYNYDEFICVPELIFNHDFAKALWGEDVEYGISEVNGHWYQIYDGDERTYIEILPACQFHLQQMVIADNPIKYLGDNI